MVRTRRLRGRRDGGGTPAHQGRRQKARLNRWGRHVRLRDEALAAGRICEYGYADYPLSPSAAARERAPTTCASRPRDERLAQRVATICAHGACAGSWPSSARAMRSALPTRTCSIEQTHAWTCARWRIVAYRSRGPPRGSRHCRPLPFRPTAPPPPPTARTTMPACPGRGGTLAGLLTPTSRLTLVRLPTLQMLAGPARCLQRTSLA